MLRKLLSLVAAAVFARTLFLLLARPPARAARPVAPLPSGPMNPVLSPEAVARIRAFSEPR